jgi:hypothetical protein
MALEYDSIVSYNQKRDAVSLMPQTRDHADNYKSKDV